jgi:hypothetical protein
MGLFVVLLFHPAQQTVRPHVTAKDECTVLLRPIL